MDHRQLWAGFVCNHPLTTIYKGLFFVISASLVENSKLVSFGNRHGGCHVPAGRYEGLMAL